VKIRSNLRRWEVIALAALAVIVITIPLSLLTQRGHRPTMAVERPAPVFVGTASCIDCHRDQY